MADQPDRLNSILQSMRPLLLALLGSAGLVSSAAMAAGRTVSEVARARAETLLLNFITFSSGNRASPGISKCGGLGAQYSTLTGGGVAAEAAPSVSGCADSHSQVV